MRIAILYICTGRYTIFWDNFYNSCESFFLKGHERHYFVFTDSEITNADSNNVHRIEQHRLGWPDDTLKRFHMFSKVKSNLEDFDFIFFFNANVLFCAPVDESIFPSVEEGIVVVLHPAFYHRCRKVFAYESNPKSQAYISADQGRNYVCGGVNGGRASSYLRMIEFLQVAIDRDEQNGVMAVWHDESHINKYILSHPHKLLSPAYCSPEESYLPFEEKIIILNKERFGGHSYLRSIPLNLPFWVRVKRFVVKASRAIYYRTFDFCKLMMASIKYEAFLFNDFFCNKYGRLHFDVDSSVHVPGFQHCTDKRWVEPARLYNLLMQKRVSNNCIESIYACYVLNYLTAEEMMKVLARWHEMLQPGGMLRLSFPDAGKVHRMYADMQEYIEKEEIFSWFSMQCGDSREESRCWKQLFSLAQLQEGLASVGFSGITTCPHVPHFGSSAYFSEPFYEVVDRSLTRNGKREYVSINLIAYK